jgi:hypothetical protein
MKVLLGLLVSQQPENCDTVNSADIDLSVDNRRRTEVTGGSELISIMSRLTRVVEFVRQVPGIVSVQYVIRVAVLDRPNDAVG